MNNFIKSISEGATATLKNRAAMMSKGAQIAQQSLVNEYERIDAELNLKLQGLMDLAPDTTVSLNPRSKDWDAKSWTKEIQTIKLQIENNRIALKAAKETYDYFFTEFEDEKKSK